MDLHRQEFVLDGPAEHPADPVDVLVDQLARPSGGDHGLADVGQGHRAEFNGWRGPVELADAPQGLADVVLLAGGGTPPSMRRACPRGGSNPPEWIK